SSTARPSPWTPWSRPPGTRTPP
ncbi:uncharacterized protein METZ01_LOCUS3966, partial [marine metagenome]